MKPLEAELEQSPVTSYEIAKAANKAIAIAHRDAADRLRAVSGARGTHGLTSDRIKGTTEWQAARAIERRLFTALRMSNMWMSEKYADAKKEERDAARITRNMIG